MTSSALVTTTVSTKGQVILPKSIRQRRGWGPGTRLTIEDTPEGILLRPLLRFPPTRPENVFGSLASPGGPKTLEEMDAGIAAEVKRRDARDPY